jgi:hypothetical protein
MRHHLTVPVLALVLALAVAGCGPVAVFRGQDTSRGSAGASPSRLSVGADVAFLLLGAREGKDIGEKDAPVPAGKKGDVGKKPPGEAGGFILRVGGGLALPGTGAIGSAPGATVPAYSDVWTMGLAYEVTGEFGAGSFRPYAQLSLSQFYGKKWTNPGTPADSWLASESTVTVIAGGARLGGKAYGKASVGLVLWPEVSRVDYSDGTADPILAGGVGFTAAVGGGAEFRLGGLRAYVDLEYVLGPTPARGANATVYWPEFKAAEASSLKLTGGLGLSF